MLHTITQTLGGMEVTTTGVTTEDLGEDTEDTSGNQDSSLMEGKFMESNLSCWFKFLLVLTIFFTLIATLLLN